MFALVFIGGIVSVFCCSFFRVPFRLLLLPVETKVPDFAENGRNGVAVPCNRERLEVRVDDNADSGEQPFDEAPVVQAIYRSPSPLQGIGCGV